MRWGAGVPVVQEFGRIAVGEVGLFKCGLLIGG